MSLREYEVLEAIPSSENCRGWPEPFAKLRINFVEGSVYNLLATTRRKPKELITTYSLLITHY